MTSGLRLTPRLMHDFYKAFSRTPPFGQKGWRLLPADEVIFKVSRTLHLGDHSYTPGKKDHAIALSELRHGHLHTMLVTLAHEMVHLVQAVEKTETPKAEHNADFRRRAKIVCRAFGFDPKEFIR